MRQIYKERHVSKHLDNSNVAPSIQNGNNHTCQQNCYSDAVSQEGGHPIYSQNYPQPFNSQPSSHAYCSTYTSLVYSVSSSTFQPGQSDFGGPFPVPVPNTVPPPPLHYPPVYASRLQAQPPHVVHHPLNIPLHSTTSNSYSPSSSLPLPPNVQLHV